MEHFVSHYTNRLDAKGRVSIPASFRSVLMRDGFEGLYVYPSFETAAVDCGGNSLLGDIESLLQTFVPFSKEHDAFSTALLGTSEILKIDPEGRIMLTESIRQHTHIIGEVTFVGQGRKFQMWEPERFRAHLDEAKASVRDMRKQLGIRNAAAGSPPPRGARE